MQQIVALLAEGVDRNSSTISRRYPARVVALLAEGVDRNTLIISRIDAQKQVALLAEGVDRNLFLLTKFFPETLSPSSRRAWIEMCLAIRAISS